MRCPTCWNWASECCKAPTLGLFRIINWFGICWCLSPKVSWEIFAWDIPFIPVGNVLARQLIRDRLIKEWGNTKFFLEIQSSVIPIWISVWCSPTKHGTLTHLTSISEGQYHHQVFLLSFWMGKNSPIQSSRCGLKKPEVLGSYAWKRMPDYILNLIPGGFQLSRAYCQWGGDGLKKRCFVVLPICW